MQILEQELKNRIGGMGNKADVSGKPPVRQTHATCSMLYTADFNLPLDSFHIR